jgi:hypothetical protein
MEVGYFGSSAKGNQGTTIMPNRCLDFPFQAPKELFFFSFFFFFLSGVKTIQISLSRRSFQK